MDIGRRDFLRHGSVAMFGLAAGLLPCERAGDPKEATLDLVYEQWGKG